jgi:3-oxoadipate enol-lactonase
MTVTLHHRIEGEGPRVLLLHAVGIDLTFLDGVARILAQEFTVLRADLRGHGKSRYAPAAGLGDYADDVHALLTGLDFAPCAIVGFAFGGMVTQALAVTHPRDARALVIASCPSRQTQESAEIVAARGIDALRDGIGSILDVTMQRWFNDDFAARGGDAATRKRLLTTDVRGWADAWNAMATIATAPHLKNIKVPTLCLVGEFDKSSPPPILQATAEAIPGARFTVMPGAPHMPFIEQPEQTARVVGEFLREALSATSAEEVGE